jgi:hypothetical protein
MHSGESNPTAVFYSGKPKILWRVKNLPLQYIIASQNSPQYVLYSCKSNRAAVKYSGESHITPANKTKI